MSFDWHLYIQQAAVLLVRYDEKTSLREASLRTSISRAYYGAFCLARNHLAATGVRIPKTDVHTFVRNAHRRSGNKVIATQLRRLRRRRNDADYRDTMTVRPGHAMKAYGQAMNVVRELEK